MVIRYASHKKQICSPEATVTWLQIRPEQIRLRYLWVSLALTPDQRKLKEKVKFKKKISGICPWSVTDLRRRQRSKLFHRWLEESSPALWSVGAYLVIRPRAPAAFLQGGMTFLQCGPQWGGRGSLKYRVSGAHSRGTTSLNHIYSACWF